MNVGVGEAIDEPRSLDGAVEDLKVITGQQPVVTRAKKSIATYKLRRGPGHRREGDAAQRADVGAVRPSGQHRVARVIRDFRGVTNQAGPAAENFTVGLREQLVFPEIDFDKIDKVRGMEITIVTTAKTDEEGRRLLSLLGMPFQGN